MYWGFTLAQHAGANPQRSTPVVEDSNLEQVPGTIVLSRFKLVGNRVIPESEIKNLLQSYLFRPLSFTELLEVQQRLTQMFIARGYLTSGAYIPPQKIADRTVVIEIIEGSLEEIKIYGLQYIRPEYIRQRLEAATKPPLNRGKLLQALQLLQLNPRIANISAELSQGVNLGTSRLEIEVEEANTFKAEFAYDNYQAVSIGSIGRRVSLSEDNLFGYGDRLAVAYTNTPSSNSLSGLSYTLPVSPRDSELQISYSYSNSSIVSEPFADLDLSNRSTYVEAIYRQPIIKTPNQELTLGFSFSYQDSQLFLMDRGFPTLARGTDVEGITKISALRLVQAYSDRSDRHVLALNSQFNIGINVLDATINPDDIPDSQFFLWRGQAQYVRQLGNSTNLWLRGGLQFADRPLVSLEQFRSGGALSVRGYRRDRSVGDNGIFFSTELQQDLWSNPQRGFSLSLIPFFDFGRVWNVDNLPLEVNTQIGVGLGLQLVLQETLTARFDWGIPLARDTGFQENSLQDNGLYFSLQLKPF
ncbi:MAG: ShlB/FhaC/HecB family hemolysin secretion/activation protein [Cyanobacteria bacterium J06623_7]